MSRADPNPVANRRPLTSRSSAWARFLTDVLVRMRTGLCDNGEMLKASAVRVLRSGERNAWLEVELREGRYRQIRRVLEAVDMECLRLVRVAIDAIKLGDLPKGAVRSLTQREVETLQLRTRMA